MKINWQTFNETWAFKFICEHYSKAMKKFIHLFDSKEPCDIQYVCSPSQFKHGIKADNKTILHIDSHRWYEVYIENE